MKNILATAISIAADGHKNQFDKGGMPYIFHPLKVTYYLKTDDFELMTIGVLHDYVEDVFKDDHQAGYDFLRKNGMTERIIWGVYCLTKIKGETPEEYLAKIMSNPDAVKVKLCDLRHNSDIRRLKGVTAKDIARLDKYCKMYNELKGL